MRLAFIILSALDLAVTAHLVYLIGIDAEANFFAVRAYKELGIWGLVIYKVFWVVFTLVVLEAVDRADKKRANAIYWFSILITLLAIGAGITAHAYYWRS